MKMVMEFYYDDKKIDEDTFTYPEGAELNTDNLYDHASGIFATYGDNEDWDEVKFTYYLDNGKQCNFRFDRFERR